MAFKLDVARSSSFRDQPNPVPKDGQLITCGSRVVGYGGSRNGSDRFIIPHLIARFVLSTGIHIKSRRGRFLGKLQQRLRQFLLQTMHAAGMNSLTGRGNCRSDCVAMYSNPLPRLPIISNFTSLF